MLATTTPTIEGKRITKYYGIVTGETIIGANLFLQKLQERNTSMVDSLVLYL